MVDLPAGDCTVPADHDPTAYGASIADDYDALYDGVLDTGAAVACLRDLAGGGPVLELGIGTGRLALPLAGHGLSVSGVEASPVMIERLAAKPGAERVSVTMGDFADVVVPGAFRLVILAFNTVFALPTAAAQMACLANAARHLVAGGRFVVEAWVLDPRLTGPDAGGDGVGSATVGLRYLTADRVSIDVAALDPAAALSGGQNMHTTQVVLSDGRIRLFLADHRYASPDELDRLADAAGLTLEDRWSGWDRAPFAAGSRAHVSVYRKD